MNVKVNRKTVSVFEGAKARHALLRYFAVKKLPLSLVDEVSVFDSYGHETDLDAPLREGQTIKFKTKTNLKPL